MIRADTRETISQYLSGLMDAQLTHFLGRKPYERNFTLKGIGEVDLQVPRVL